MDPRIIAALERLALAEEANGRKLDLILAELKRGNDWMDKFTIDESVQGPSVPHDLEVQSQA